MNKLTERDLTNIRSILEDLVPQAESMSLPDLVDLAARLKPVAKACKAIDDKAKKEIGLDLDGKPGTVLGGMFKAILNQFPVTRLNQARLETERPRIWASYRETNDEQRITYEVR